ncbi:hypothetical protein MUY27_00300 [Mucilaginibacter sp. RS28]|uniref:Uncharacterized protein n=1 Tax=Mucilaginibacter straminoryzae TaxID=2932774 RepID=A0A9X2B7W4_9SPHI|nr:hypothetical protein [Mucilaginibacter straminoryzae]
MAFIHQTFCCAKGLTFLFLIAYTKQLIAVGIFACSCFFNENGKKGQLRFCPGSDCYRGPKDYGITRPLLRRSLGLRHLFRFLLDVFGATFFAFFFSVFSFEKSFSGQAAKKGMSKKQKFTFKTNAKWHTTSILTSRQANTVFSAYSKKHGTGWGRSYRITPQAPRR